MPVTTLSFETVNQSIWGAEVPTDRLSTEDFLIRDISTREDIDLNLGVLRLDGELAFEGRVGLEAYVDLSTAGTFDAAAELVVDLDYTKAVYTGDGGPIALTFDFTNYSYGVSTLNHLGFGLGDDGEPSPTVGLDLIVELDAGLRGFSFWSGLPSVDLGLLGETPEITIYEASIDGYDFPKVDQRVQLFGLSAGDPVFEYENKRGFVEATLNFPAGAKIDAIANGLSSVEGEGVSPVAFFEASLDIDKLFTTALKALVVSAKVGKFLEKTVFLEKTFDINDFLSFIPEGELGFGLTALDLGAELDISVKERASLDLTNGGTEADVAVSLVFDPTPDDSTDNHLNTTTTTKLGEVHTFDLSNASAGAIATGIGNAQVTARYALAAEYELGMGFDIRGALTVTALKAEFSGTLFDDDAKFEWAALDERFPEDGLGFDFIIPGISEYEVSSFNTVTEVYDVAYSDFAPRDYVAGQAGADDALLGLINEVRNSSVLEVTALLGGLSADYVEATDAGALDAIAAAADATPSGHRAVTNGFFSTGGYTQLTSWDNSDWLLWELLPANPAYSKDIASNNDGIIAGVDSDFETKLQLLETYAAPFASTNLSTGYYVDGATQLFWREDLIGTVPGVNVVGGSGDDLIAYNGTYFAQYFDGGAGNDVFVADLRDETAGQDVLINASVWGEGTTVPLFYPHDGLQITNFEGFFIKLGSGNDKVIIPMNDRAFLSSENENFVSTGGGNDYVSIDFTLSGLTGAEHYGDAGKDVVLLGAGDDVAIAYASKAEEVSDFYAGGDGLDLVRIVAGRTPGFVQFGPADRAIGINIQAADGTMSFGGQGVTGTATFQQIGQLLRAYRDHILDAPGDLAAFANSTGSGIEDAPVASLHYTHGTTSGFGSTGVFADVEAVGARVNSGVSNIVMFTGATGAGAYTGSRSTSARNPVDLFVADFAAVQTLETSAVEGEENAARLEDIDGLTLDISTSDTQSFVNGSGIVGFDRLYVRGSNGNDRIIGSGEVSREDYIDGGAGNDLIDGGNDVSADSLIGGTGSDTFLWSNDGLDTVSGGGALGNEASVEIDWLIIGDPNDTSVSAGLNYRYTANIFELLISNAPVRNAQSDFGDLWNLLNSDPYNSLSVFNIGYGTGFGVEFKGVEKTNVVGSDAYDDLVVYQQGAHYDLGERAGDADVFVGKFTNSDVGITFTITDNETVGQVLENGTEVIGADRAMLLGSTGRDNFMGGALQDFLHGFDGDDTLDGGGGDDLIRGGKGDDVIRWRGEGNATVEGGEGHDNLIIGTATSQLSNAIEWQFFDATGTAETGVLGATSGMFDIFGPTFEQTVDETADVIIGGNTVNVLGVEGISIIGSDQHADLFIHDEGILYFGGRGAATDTFAAILSDVTENLVLRADGRDAYNRAETEPVYWSIGNGAEIAQMERFVLLSGAGDDRIVGGSSDFGDLLSGNRGNDTLESGGGLLDRIEGNAGDDILIATAGTMGAQFSGQEDIDTFIGAVDSTVTLQVLADSFTVLGGTFAAAGFNLAGAQDLLSRVTDTSGVEYLSEGQSAFKLLTLEKFNITAGAGDDILLAGALSSVLYGGMGDDVLVSRAGDDILVGEDGTDTYVFAADFGDDIIAAEDVSGGRLMFTGHTRADLSFDAEGLDLIVTTTTGTVRLRDYFQTGGNGAAFAVVALDGTFTPDLSALGGAAAAGLTRFARALGDETSNLGDGYLQTSDTANSLAAATGLGVVQGQGGDDQIFAFDGADVVDGGLGNDAIYYSASTAGVMVDLATGLGSNGAAQGEIYIGIENAVGSDHNDTLMGNEQANFLNGNRGSDRMSGGAGADEIFGGRGNDTVEGGDGDDALSGGLGNDVLQGGLGNDLLSGQQGDDMVFGGEGDDSLFGGDGMDTVDGGAGQDTLSGGKGADVLNGGAGERDRVDYTTSEQGVDVSLARDAQRGGDADGDSLQGIEDLAGSLQNDILGGNDLSNIIAGQAGDDEMRGLLGIDVLFGGDGADTIVGGLGADTLTGDGGDDYVFGDDFEVTFAREASYSVYRLYQTTFNRPPDEIGHEYWTERLYTGASTLQSVREGFVGSREFQRTYAGFNNEDFVKQMYINVLQRDFNVGQVRQEEIDSWTSQLSDSFTRADVVNGFAQSRELVIRTNEEATQTALRSELSSWTDEVFRIYQATLDRAPDVGGMMDWMQRLASGSLALLDVIRGFTLSAEFTQTYGDLDDTAFVTLLYANVLDRAPDQAGLDGWLGALNEGQLREQIVSGFANSQEFINATNQTIADVLRGYGSDDEIHGGAGSNVVSGGALSDVFVFDQEDAGTHTVLDVEAWDSLRFEGFEYTSISQARAHFTQVSGAVVFSDQGTTITLQDLQLSQLSDDMILI